MRKALSAIRFVGTVGVLIMSSCTSGEVGVGQTGAQQSLFVAGPGSPLTIASEPSDVVLGDMNKDGRLDLVVANGQARSILVLLNDDTGDSANGGAGKNGPFRVAAARTSSAPDNQ